MTNPNSYVGALSFLITALIAFVSFYWVWQQFVIDSTRQQLFELRDELFDLASAGCLERDGEAYQILRKILNNSIRYAHDLDIWRLFIWIFTTKLTNSHHLASPVKHLDEVIRKIPDVKVRNHVLSIIQKKTNVLVWHIYRRSLFLLIAVPIAGVVLSMYLVSTDLFSRMIKKLGILISATVASTN